MTVLPIPTADHGAKVIPLRTALQRSISHSDEVDLAGDLLKCGGELSGCGEGIRQLAILGDQPSVHMLGDVIALLHAAERDVCAYAVARGLRLSMAPVPLPADCERSE